MNFLSCRKGQSLLEVIVALAIFSLIVAAMITMATGGFESLNQGGDQTTAQAMAEQGMEGVRAIHDRAWNELVFATSSITTTTGSWSFVGENTTQNIGKFLRTISFSPVCRDGGNNITTCPGSYTDLYSKLVNVDISWSPRTGATNTVRQTGYLTNWESKKWAQTDWSGSGGQGTWSVTNKYDSDNGSVDVTSTPGQVTLKAQSTLATGAYDWTFASSTDYTYNAGEISVTSGVASLVDQGTGGSCAGTPTTCSIFSSSTSCSAQGGCGWISGGTASTTNSAFSTSSVGWTYTDWVDSNNKASGAWFSTGGNPSGNVRITIGGQKNLTISGYYYQAFTTTANNATGTLNYDWKSITYNAKNVVSLRIYVFIDTTSGAPTIGTEVASSSINNIGAWTSRSIDISSKLAIAGTYYVKLAVQEVLNNNAGTPGTSVIGFDNAKVTFTNSSTCSGTATVCSAFGASGTCSAQNGCGWSVAPAYPTDKPTINPTSSLIISGLKSWTSFTETANTNGGTIYYQLFDNNGVTWKFWNGSWVTSTLATDYNTSSTVNTNISTFNTSTGQISVKAFLISDGSQQVILDNINIGYLAATGANAFQTLGVVTSSAFNMSDSSPVQILEWDQDVSSCSSCGVQLQLRTAPNNAGSPGAWSSWYGASGAGTYFTNPAGTLLPTVLNWNQWVQYRAQLTGDGVTTPVLQEVRLDYK